MWPTKIGFKGNYSIKNPLHLSVILLHKISKRHRKYNLLAIQYELIELKAKQRMKIELQKISDSENKLIYSCFSRQF